MAISNWRKWLSSISSPSAKPIRRPTRNEIRPRIEFLENRLAPTINLAQVATQIVTVLQTVETTLTTIDNVANKIPIIDKAFRDIPEVVAKIAAVRTDLADAVSGANTANLEATIKGRIVDFLGPAGLDILGDSSGNGVVNTGDVSFTLQAMVEGF